MAKTVVEGVQLPADSSGRITAAFVVQGTAETPPDATTGENTITIPATALVDERGVEIGSRILAQLEAIAARLERLEDLTTLSTAVLTG